MNINYILSRYNNSNDLIGKEFKERIEDVYENWKVVDVIEEDYETNVIIVNNKGTYKAIRKE